MNLETVFCPFCGRPLKYPSSLRGSLVQCKHCSAYFKWEVSAVSSLTTSNESSRLESCSTPGKHGVNSISSAVSSHNQSVSGSIVKSACIVALAIVVVGVVYCAMNYMGSRYSLDTIDKKTYRLDRHTGKMSLIKANGDITDVKEPVTIKSRELSVTEVQELEGWAGLQYDGTSFSGSVHNGNRHVVVTEVDIDLFYTNAERRVHRIYKSKGVIEPFGTCEVFFNIVKPGRDLAYSGYRIESARGYTSVDDEGFE